MKEVREIITIKGWVDGSGWSYNQVYFDRIIKASSYDLEPNSEMDWEWWELNDEVEGKDMEITVRHFAVDADPYVDSPIAEWSTWESELRNA